MEADDRHTIVLTSRRMAPLSLEQLLSLVSTRHGSVCGS